jgi:Ca2+/Na+ antiporter
MEKKLTKEFFILSISMSFIIQIIGGGLCLYRDYPKVSVGMVIIACFILFFIILAIYAFMRMKKHFDKLSKQWVALMVFNLVALLFFIIAFVLFLVIYKMKEVPKICVSLGAIFLYYSVCSAIMKYLNETKKTDA